MAGSAQAGRCDWAALAGRESEGEGPFELNQSWGGITAQERSQNARRSIHCADDCSEVRIGNISNRLIEVGMVEQIEELSPDTKFRMLPSRDVEVLHYREVCVEVLRAIELVASLDAEGVRGRRKHRRGQAGLIDRTRIARRRSATVIIGEHECTNPIESPSIVIGCQIGCLIPIHHSERQTAACKDRARKDPSVQKWLWTPPVRHGPHVVETEVVPYIVVGTPIVVAFEIGRIL